MPQSERRVSVYAISRDLWDHPDFEDEPYTQKQAWAWLIGAAAYQEKRIRAPRGPVTLKRGEFCFSVRFLAQKWLWDKGKAHRYLLMLKKRDMVRDTIRDSNQVYLINNYNKFQIVKAPRRDSEQDASRDKSGTRAGQERDKEKDSKDSKDRESIGADAPKSKKRSRSSLPEIWPTEIDRAWAFRLWREKGREDLCAEIEAHMAESRDHHSAANTLSADWPATWRTWATRAIRYNRKAGQGHERKPTAHENLQRGTILALERMGCGEGALNSRVAE